jgi:hypothetical protein
MISNHKVFVQIVVDKMDFSGLSKPPEAVQPQKVETLT